MIIMCHSSNQIPIWFSFGVLILLAICPQIVYILLIIFLICCCCKNKVISYGIIVATIK